MRHRAWSAAVVAVGSALAAAIAACGGSGDRAVKETSVVAGREAGAADNERMAWWREARFGMFIHWGLYSIPAGQWGDHTDYGEWIRSEGKIPVEEYEKLRERFNPVKFDADAWVKMAKAAGMQYIVITTKHHDGFCLFDSAYTDWDVMSTPFQRDIMKEMADACRREGIRICWYHSIMDWHHPDYLPRRDFERQMRPEAGADFERFNEYLKNQVRELLTNYGDIGVMWFDGQWEGTWTHERGVDLDNHVRSLQPRIIVNNRVDKGGGTFGMTKSAEFKGDFGTPEQEIPPSGFPGVDWETCMTMNDHWGYNSHDKNFKSSRELIRKLADIASKGGNFLLNIGPTSEGEFPPESVERLRDIGAWMSVNGESIHGTMAGPFKKLGGGKEGWGRCTQRVTSADGDVHTRLYLHVFDWPADGRLVVPGLYNEPRGAFLLADWGRAPLTVAREGDGLAISVPGAAPDATDTVVVLDIDGRPDVAEPPEIQAAAASGGADASIFVTSMDVAVRSDRENVQVRYTVDGSEPMASSPVAERAVRLDRTATVKARAFRGERAVSLVGERTFTKVAPRPATTLAKTEPGMRYEYFEGDWDRLPDFDAIQPKGSGTAEKFDRQPRQREDRFAFLYYGYVNVPEDGAYTFWTNSDDGSQLYIGDQLVVDNDGLHSERDRSGTVALGKGLHLMTVTMFEKSGGHQLQVWMAGPGTAKRELSGKDLVREP